MFLSSVFNKQFLKYKMFYPAPFRASLKPCTVTKVRQCPRVGPALHLEEEEEEAQLHRIVTKLRIASLDTGLGKNLTRDNCGPFYSRNRFGRVKYRLKTSNCLENQPGYDRRRPCFC